MPDSVSSKSSTKSFVDDIILYRVIKTPEDATGFQCRCRQKDCKDIRNRRDTS